MEKIKVFLDSNVIFAIAYSGTKSSRSYVIYEIQSMGKIEVYVSNLVCAEAIHNIRIKKTGQLNLLQEIIRKSKVLADVMIDIGSPLLNKLPNNDRVILSTAISHEMDIFLTGNVTDFRTLYHKTIVNTLILTPKDFINRNF